MKHATSITILCRRHKFEVQAIGQTREVYIRRCPICMKRLDYEPVLLIPQGK